MSQDDDKKKALAVLKQKKEPSLSNTAETLCGSIIEQ